MATKTLSVKLELNIKGFSKNIKKATKQMTASMKKMGASMTSMGKTLSASITLPALVAGGAMVKLASDAEETNNKFKEIFGKSAPATKKALDALSDSVGRNSTTLKEFAGDMGGVITSMGFSDEEAGKLSSTMIQLGVDVASFRNKSDAQVLNAFTSALVGEREALKSLGVSILDADVKQEAFNMGIFKGKGALSKRATVLATQSLLFKRFAKDQGDAMRTSEGFANVLKRFNASLKTMGEEFGKVLLPVVNEFLQLITPMVEEFGKLDTTTKIITLSLIAFAASIGPITLGLGLMVSAAGLLWPVIVSVATAIGTALVAMAPFAALLAVTVLAVKQVGKVIGILAQLLSHTLVAVINDLVKPAIEGVIQVVNFLMGKWTKLITLIKTRSMAKAIAAETAFLKKSEKTIKSFLKANEKVAKEVSAEIEANIGKFGEMMEEGSDDMLSNLSSAGKELAKEAGKIGKDAGNELMDTMKAVVGEGLSSLSLGKAQKKRAKTKKISDEKRIGPVHGPEQAPIGDVDKVAEVEKAKTALQSFMEESQNISGQFDQMWAGTFQNFSAGFSDSIAGAIVEGEDLADSMKSLMTDMVKQIIQQLIQMGVQWVLSSVVARGASAAMTTTALTNNGITAASGAAASQAGIPVIGPILAIAAMGAMMAAVMALQGGIALADGGITTGPTNALIGEAGQEAVIPLDQLDSMMGVREQTINIDLDGKTITRSVIRNMPREVRIRTGVTY